MEKSRVGDGKKNEGFLKRHAIEKGSANKKPVRRGDREGETSTTRATMNFT